MGGDGELWIDVLAPASHQFRTSFSGFVFPVVKADGRFKDQKDIKPLVFNPRDHNRNLLGF